MKSLREIMNELSQVAYGMTRDEAQQKGICISCKKNFIAKSDLEAREYRISALCDSCFHNVTGKEE